jgi:hypothetical protein
MINPWLVGRPGIQGQVLQSRVFFFFPGNGALPSLPLRDRTWIATSHYQSLSLQESRWIVHPEQRNGGSSSWRFSNQGCAHQSKMFAPVLYTWVEQGHHDLLYRVNCR